MHNLDEWQVPQRQSPASIFILFLKTLWETIKQFWFVLVIYLLKGRQAEQPFSFQWIIWGFIGLSFVITILKYWFYKFHIQDQNLHIYSGWWKRKHLTIPLKSIQAVHLEQSIWQQLLKVAKVSFDSSGSEQVEARIEALSLKKAEILKEILLQEAENNTSLNENGLPAPAENKKYQLSETDVLKLSLSANHLRAFFVLLVFAVKFFADAEELLDADQREAMEEFKNSTLNALSWLFFAVMFLLIGGVSVVVSAFRVFMEYYNFRMEETPKGWKVAHGLFTQKQKAINRSKIQLVTYRTNWIRNLLDFWFVDLSITGQDKLKKQARINIPLTSLESVQSLASQYLPHANIAKSGETISKAYWLRKTLTTALPMSLVLVGVLYLLSKDWKTSILTASVIGMYWTIHLRIWQKKFRWLAQEDGLVIFKGVWGKSYTLLKWQKIQQASFTQNLYQRRQGLASITFVTAGGQASIPYLPLTTAQMLVNQTFYRIESKQETWL